MNKVGLPKYEYTVFSFESISPMQHAHSIDTRLAPSVFKKTKSATGRTQVMPTARVTYQSGKLDIAHHVP